MTTSEKSLISALAADLAELERRIEQESGDGYLPVAAEELARNYDRCLNQILASKKRLSRRPVVDAAQAEELARLHQAHDKGIANLYVMAMFEVLHIADAFRNGEYSWMRKEASGRVVACVSRLRNILQEDWVGIKSVRTRPRKARPKSTT